MTKLLHDLPIVVRAVALAPLFAIVCPHRGGRGGTPFKSGQQRRPAIPWRRNNRHGWSRFPPLKTRVVQLDAMVMRSSWPTGCSGMKAVRVEAVDRAIDAELKAPAGRAGEAAEVRSLDEQPIYADLRKSLDGFARLTRDTLDMKSSGPVAGGHADDVGRAGARPPVGMWDKLAALGHHAVMLSWNAPAARLAPTWWLGIALALPLLVTGITWLVHPPRSPPLKERCCSPRLQATSRCRRRLLVGTKPARCSSPCRRWRSVSMACFLARSSRPRSMWSRLSGKSLQGNQNPSEAPS